MRQLPSEFPLDQLDGRGSRRRPGSEQANAAWRTSAAVSAGALAMPISTVGAAQNIVMLSSLDQLDRSVPGSTRRRQTCVIPRAVLIHMKVQPLAWNIGKVQR